jgi:hypothetical protein
MVPEGRHLTRKEEEGRLLNQVRGGKPFPLHNLCQERADTPPSAVLYLNGSARERAHPSAKGRFR